MLFVISKSIPDRKITPTITVDFVHVFRWNANDSALFDHFRVLPNNRLHYLKVFHSDLLTVSTIRHVDGHKHLQVAVRRLFVPN